MPRSAVASCILALLFVLLGAGSARAQAPAEPLAVLRGRVVDSTGAPVPATSVALAPGGRATAVDDAGDFAFTRLAPGRYVLRVRRIGWFPIEVAVELAAGETRDTTFVLRPHPRELSPIEVLAATHHKRLAGVLQRQASGLGAVLFAEDLARYDYASTEQALQHNGRLHLVLPTGRLQPGRSIRSSVRGGCGRRIFVNGRPAGAGGLPPLDEIEAIEAHRNTDFILDAAEFDWNPPCGGVILIWTKSALRRKP